MKPGTVALSSHARRPSRAEPEVFSADPAGALWRQVKEELRMDVTLLPFNRLVGLERAAPESGFLVTLPDGPQYANHLGTVHAVALLAVAEAGAGAFLARQENVPAGIVPVVRRVEAKFRRPAKGRVSARCSVPDAEVAA
jgi:acyl-coenzyme A thioesterase PaaI-like protein